MIRARLAASQPAHQAPLPAASHSRGKENQVKFMLQVRFNGADKAIGELPAGDQETVTAEFEEIRRSAGVLDGNQLQAASTAATVRVDGRQPRVSEGPAVAAGSELDGYYLYDAADLDAAIAFAQRIPATRFGATVEVRPVLER
jgi:hypothetical protein